ncbi:hypothetical protein [Laspinema olomoucense]|uniref:hypothetical protein n=1 Tax=Laspinema olomoucense TaxID=3231600 RepID=UPI0021BA4754|nr:MULTISPECIES: hypothetical protein [unclassified Laspinema]MCT7991385.1 hypothetical protein [Laspinema sp. D3a]MCT7996019.1 hypothetical protein [Laspinema sp. D3c]
MQTRPVEARLMALMGAEGVKTLGSNLVCLPLTVATTQDFIPKIYPGIVGDRPQTPLQWL